MKPISTFLIWVNGENKSASLLNAKIIHDNLSSSCTFYYEITDQSQEVLANGNVLMDGQDYEDWDNSNEEAYSYIAEKINVTLV